MAAMGASNPHEPSLPDLRRKIKVVRLGSKKSLARAGRTFANDNAVPLAAAPASAATTTSAASTTSAAAAAASAASAATAATAALSLLFAEPACSGVLLVEDEERPQADVGDFLLA